MDEEWIARDVEVNRLSARGKNYSEADKACSEGESSSNFLG